VQDSETNRPAAGDSDRGDFCILLKGLTPIYELIEVVRGHGVEYEAFAKAQRKMSINEDGSVPFRLYDLLMPLSTTDGLVVLYNGCKHLCLDCLRDD